MSHPLAGIMHGFQGARGDAKGHVPAGATPGQVNHALPTGRTKDERFQRDIMQAVPGIGDSQSVPERIPGARKTAARRLALGAVAGLTGLLLAVSLLADPGVAAAQPADAATKPDSRAAPPAVAPTDGTGAAPTQIAAPADSATPLFPSSPAAPAVAPVVPDKTPQVRIRTESAPQSPSSGPAAATPRRVPGEPGPGERGPASAAGTQLAPGAAAGAAPAGPAEPAAVAAPAPASRAGTATLESSGGADAGKHAPAGEGNIELNFRNVDILSFIQLMSQAMSIPMAWDEKDIHGKITVVSPRRFSRNDAFRIFETVLDMQGYSLVRRQDSPLVQVVPSKDAARYPGPTITSEEAPNGLGGFVTQLVPLKYADANQVRTALQQIQSKTGAIAVYPPGNLLIVSDTQDNIQRLLAVLKELDTEPGDVEYTVIRLKYGSSRLLSTTITSLMANRRGQPGQPPQPGQADLRVVSDDRTNSLILVGDAFATGKVRELLEQLDVPGVAQNAGVRVFKLQHADADELVKILRDVRLSPALGTQGAISQPGIAQPISQPVGGIAGTGGGVYGSQFGSGTGITADKPTNSLIVFGSPEFISAIEEMVVKLDVRRPQVFVQVLIMEMTLAKSLNLGVRWQATSPVGGNIIGAGNPNAAPQTLTDAVANGQGAAIGAVGNTITFGGNTYTSFSAFIQATRQDQDLNVLANPQLLTLNNEEAQINVSQVIPVSAKILTNVNNQTTTEFEFKDVGIILKITPSITGDDKVRLLIDQESSSVASQQTTTSINQNAITTLKRKLSTKVLVDDNSVMAIGGLIQDQKVVSETKVPCLGDIPFLGWLFKSRNESIQKTNLIVFIRPQIIHTQEQGEATTRQASDRYESTRGINRNTEERLRADMGLPARPAPAQPSTAQPAPKKP